MVPKICSVHECAKPHKAKGLCAVHYSGLLRRAKGVPQKPSSDAERFWMKVDKSGDCWEWAAYIAKDGYGKFSVDGRGRGAHRVSYEWAVGPVTSGMMIDHMCHNRACVNPDHLRVVTSKQNQENRIGPMARNTSGARGVSWSKHKRKWYGRVGHHGSSVFVGLFDNLDDAEAAVIAKRLELHTHNNRDRISA